MNLSELYLPVNPQLKEIRGAFQYQPQDYKNICTFPGLEEDKKADLSWAGLPEEGFIRGEKLKDYSCNDAVLNELKFNIKRRIEENIKDLFAKGVVFKNITFPVDPESLSFANMQNKRHADYLKDHVAWHKFSRDEMYDLVGKMNKKFDEIVEIEIEFHRLVDESSTVYELSQLNYDI